MTRMAPIAALNLDDPIAWTFSHADQVAVGALIALGIVGLMLIARRIGHGLKDGDPDCRGWRGIIGRALSRTTIFFMVAAAIGIVCNYAPLPRKIARLSEILFVIAAALQAAIWAREIILGVIASRVGDDDGQSTLGNAMALIRVLVSVALFAIAIIVILDNLGVNVTALVAGLGIGGIAIGLAAQGIFSDLFAALAIVFDRPFRRGDTVRYGTTVGTVEKIGLKTTRLRSITGEQVIIANTKLLEQEVHNLADATVRRITVPIAITYQTPPELIEALNDIAAQAIKPVRYCTLVRCVPTGFAASAIDVELVYDDRSSDPQALAAHKSAILIAIVRLFADRGIAFAYPTQTSFTAAPDGTLIMPYDTKD